MQNDLISRSALIELLRNNTSNDIQDQVITENNINLIMSMPTAYDVEKVVEELEEQIDNNRGWEDEDYYWGETKGYEHAIEIVRNGGKE